MRYNYVINTMQVTHNEQQIYQTELVISLLQGSYTANKNSKNGNTFNSQKKSSGGTCTLLWPVQVLSQLVYQPDRLAHSPELF